MTNRLLLFEMAARRIEERSTFLAATPYFRDNFTFEDRVKAFGRWLMHGVELVVWGYGVRLSALVLSSLVLVLLAAAISWLGGAIYSVAGAGNRVLSLPESIYASLVTDRNQAPESNARGAREASQAEDGQAVRTC